jgi:hypothetical protein
MMMMSSPGVQDVKVSSLRFALFPVTTMRCTPAAPVTAVTRGGFVPNDEPIWLSVNVAVPAAVNSSASIDVSVTLEKFVDVLSRSLSVPAPPSADSPEPPERSRIPL